MQQLQLQQAQIQREQARVNDFWGDVGREMAQIDPEKVCMMCIPSTSMCALLAYVSAFAVPDILCR